MNSIIKYVVHVITGSFFSNGAFRCMYIGSIGAWRGTDADSRPGMDVLVEIGGIGEVEEVGEV